MTILFAGGELDDFVLNGTVSANTTSSTYRPTYARMSVNPDGGAFGVNYAKASFTASSAFSVTARFYPGNVTYSTDAVFFWLATGGSARLRLKVNSGAPATFTLQSYTSGGVATTLATSGTTLALSTVYRLDILVSYGASGSVKVYVDGTLTLDTGVMDVTASGATTLDGAYFSTTKTTSNACGWSEVIICTQDSRTLSLKTLVPDAAGTANAWTGAYTDIDETTASDTDVLTSATALQVANFNTTGMPSGWANLSVTAVKVVASAARGSTGPSKLALGVRTNSADSFPTAVTLDTGFSAPVTTTYELNPVTGIAWTTAEIDALQIAFKSET